MSERNHAELAAITLARLPVGLPQPPSPESRERAIAALIEAMDRRRRVRRRRVVSLACAAALPGGGRRGGAGAAGHA
jgi:hypothetical protein